MKVNYNVTDAQLDSLVAAISEELNAPINRSGTPAEACEVGGYNIDKTGVVTGADNWELVADLQGLHSFKAVSVEYDTVQETEEIPPFESLRLSEREELGLGRERRDHLGEDGMLASDVPELSDVIFQETFACMDSAGEWRDETLSYPASKETLAKFLSDVGIGSIDKNRRYYFKAFECFDSTIERYLPGNTNFDEMNYLAARIQELSAEQRKIFSAAVETGRYMRMDKLINLAANIDNFTLIPNAEDGGISTSKGYLVESGEFKNSYRFLDDIPSEERATAHLDRLTLPDAIAPIRDVELSPLLLQIHAVCGDYLFDAPANLARLDGMRSSEFLLLLDENGAFFTEASHAYREGSPQHERFMSVTDSPGTHVFALHVTNIWTQSGEDGESMRGPIIGDLVYEDLRDRQWDIKLNAIVPTVIDGRRHFELSDYASVRTHLERVAEHHENSDAEEKTPHEFLSVINHSYMAEVDKKPSPDVIRIPNQVAKEMLARSDGPIQLIVNDGTETLTRQDILRVLKFGKDDAFAVKPDDFPGFEKWAKRTAPEMVKQAQTKERGEHRKTKDEEL